MGAEGRALSTWIQRDLTKLGLEANVNACLSVQLWDAIPTGGPGAQEAGIH